MLRGKTTKFEIHRRKLRGRGLSHLDIEILHFLWRWKLATAAVLHAVLSPAVKPSAFNKRLRKLGQNGFIESDQELVAGFHYWQLTDAGIWSIREGLREPVDLGFRSPSPSHDRFVQTICLRPWVDASMPVPLIFTDQELLKRKVSYWPSWVPRGGERRPDAYIGLRFNDRPSLNVAIELELFAKAKIRYEGIGYHYRSMMNIDKIVWVVPDDSVADAVRSGIVGSNYRDTNWHLFVKLQDLEENGARALLYNERSEIGGTIAELFGVPEGAVRGEYAGTEGLNSKSSAFSDRRKFLRVSKA